MNSGIEKLLREEISNCLWQLSQEYLSQKINLGLFLIFFPNPEPDSPAEKEFKEKKEDEDENKTE